MYAIHLLLVSSITASWWGLANEMRVSCGAMLERSQTDGLRKKRRRQLHALVRPRT